MVGTSGAALAAAGGTRRAPKTAPVDQAALENEISRLAGEIEMIHKPRIAGLEAELEQVREAHQQEVENHLKTKQALATLKGEKLSKTKVAARPAKARKLGDMKVDREALTAAMTSGEPMQLAFSTGTKEIDELDPLEVHGEGFQRAGGGRYHLRDAPIVKAARHGIRIRGVALVGADGAQVGWCPFPEAIELPAGQDVRFASMIAF